MPEELSHAGVEAAAFRRLVEKLMVDHEAHVNSTDPAVLLPLVLEPFFQLGKLAVVEVWSRDANAIDVAAGLVERVIGQRAPEADANQVLTKHRGEIGGHRLKKAGEIPGYTNARQIPLSVSLLSSWQSLDALSGYSESTNAIADPKP